MTSTSAGDRSTSSCIGRGSPTIVLETGDGDPTRPSCSRCSDVLGHDYRTCVYDRAGKGSSDARRRRPARRPAMTEDLGGLLDVANVPGPYVLVGTSLGGVAAYLFAAAHPDDVVGFVSINPPTDPTALEPRGPPARHRR